MNSLPGQSVRVFWEWSDEIVKTLIQQTSQSAVDSDTRTGSRGRGGCGPSCIHTTRSPCKLSGGA